MTKVNFFKSIVLLPRRDNIFRRLGYRSQKTRKIPITEDRVIAYIDEAADMIDLKGSARCMDIKSMESRKIVLSQEIVFKSQDLAKFLKKATEALLMAATVSPAFMKVIYQKDGQDNLTRAVIFDAVASEMVEDALNWIMAYYQQALKREGKRLDSRRFSAGYGDFRLRHQQVFYDCLKMKRLNVHINKRFLLDPEKSVTAITGIYTIS